MSKDQKRELVGRVCVDSGLMMVLDPCAADMIDGTGYEEICQAMEDPRTLHTEIKNQFRGVGVVVCSGYGDGVYPVYATTVLDGTGYRRCVKLEVLMDLGDSEE